MKKLSGSVSIYFVFAIILIISVIMSVTEMARINCQKLYLQLATDAGLDSMASLYHRTLYEYYSLYGVEYKTKDLLETEYLSYMEPYFTDGDAYINNWYIASIDEEHIDLNYKTLVSENYLEKEIVNYMRLKIVGKAINFLGESFSITEESDIERLKEKVESVFEEIEKDDIYSEIYDRYFDFASDIRTLENHARTIMSYVDKVNIRLNSIKTMPVSGTLSNGNQIRNKIDALLREADTLKSALISFRNRMNDFKNKVYESRDNYLSDREQGTYNFTDDVCEFIESEFDRFISYVDEYSEMCGKVDEGIDNLMIIKDQVEIDKREIDSYVSELDSIEDELAHEMSQHGEDRDNDYIEELRDERREIQDDFSDYLKDMKDTYRDYKMETIEILVSTNTHSSEVNLLDRLIGYKNGIVLNLVLDSEEVDRIEREIKNISSFNILTHVDTLSVDKLLLGEYELDKFNYYNKEKSGELVKSGSTSLEVERLIAGKNSDFDNIKTVIDKILLMRIALNVLYIYIHPDKRQAVRSFTMALFSGFSPLLAEAMFILVLTAWGTAQSLADVKKILKGKKVSFMHTDETWSVSLTNILDVARNGISESEDNDDRGLAFNYKDYLRIFLISTNQREINGRMAGIVESNLRKLQNNFDFNKLIYSFDTKNDFVSKHLFTNFVFIPAKDITLYDQYKIPVKAYRSFYD